MENNDEMTLPDLIKEAGRYASAEGGGRVFIPSAVIFHRYGESINSTYIRNTINRTRLFKEKGLRASVSEQDDDDGWPGFLVRVTRGNTSQRSFSNADMAEARIEGANEIRNSVSSALPSTYVNLDEFAEDEKPIAIKAIELFKIQVIRLLK